jgi:hypothetical protein
MQVPRLTYQAVDPEALAVVLGEMQRRIEALEKALSDKDEFGNLPPWVKLEDAKMITGYSDGRTINKWVERGVIRVKVVSEAEKRYSKDDCLNFAARAEQWKIEND